MLVQERIQCEVSVVAVVPMNDLLDSLPDPGIMGEFRLQPLQGNPIFEVSPG